MKNKILKILGVLALATLSMNTMAWKVNYGKNSNQQIEMLDSEILVANNLEFVNDKALGTAEFQSARYYKETTDSEGNKREAYVVTSSGKKINCLTLENGENRLCLNVDSLSGVNEFLVQKLEDFIDNYDDLCNFDTAFINRIRSVIASYHIAKTLDIDSETWKNAEGNESSAFIDAALNIALPDIAGNDASQSVQKSIDDIKNQITRDLFGSNSDKIDEAFNAVMLLNICGNKCRYNPKAVLVRFFKEQQNAKDRNQFESDAIAYVRRPFLQHCSKHITPINIIKAELEPKLRVYERFVVVEREIKNYQSIMDEKHRLTEQQYKQFKALKTEKSELKKEKDRLDTSVNLNEKPLKILQDAKNPFTVVTFDRNDLHVTKYEDAPQSMQNFIKHLINSEVLNKVEMRFENNSFQIYVPSTTEQDGIEKIPVITDQENKLVKLGNYSIYEAKLSEDSKLKALDKAISLPNNTKTNLFFKFIIPISIKTSIRNTEYGSCFFIVLNQAS